MRCDLLIAQKDKSTAGTDMTCQILFDKFLDVSAVLRACCASVHSFLVWVLRMVLAEHPLRLHWEINCIKLNDVCLQCAKTEEEECGKILKFRESSNPVLVGCFVLEFSGGGTPSTTQKKVAEKQKQGKSSFHPQINPTIF
ncbi:hypothetical protein PAPYR_13342 [Paratrimastix pyriformis]|uniref:Uncharacterized protein n=1 Tax=Paratrimastix pyriformis TaxID=342808 RepID=A0ABQ8U0C4_9EUKA|nr:hypothetical protein PAPYR_13342 [Paratrimastix pyriformis]